MFTEFKIRQRFSAIWSSGRTPIGKAKAFLRLARGTRESAMTMAEQGFAELHKGRKDQASRFWEHSARLLALSDRARNLAKSALRGRGSYAASPQQVTGTAKKSWAWLQERPVPNNTQMAAK